MTYYSGLYQLRIDYKVYIGRSLSGCLVPCAVPADVPAARPAGPWPAGRGPGPSAPARRDPLDAAGWDPHRGPGADLVLTARAAVTRSGTGLPPGTVLG